MSVPNGARLGPYEILDLIGAGGMGEVYRARDTRLGRTVAIKVLLANRADSESRQRFEREARAVSSLSQPNICSIYDVGQQDGIDFLVMEYLEGETLAARLAKGALPKDQLVRYALQIVQALAQAHRNGVLHRDLKPGNVMITPGGVKLLDFGLAKLSQPQPFDSAASELPTLSQDLTVKGAILGTIQYMSPEQLEGKPTDPRSDIFSFGAVLYEMATGRRAFAGESAASVIASILKQDPAPLDAQEAAIPATLDRVIRRCLAKDPDSRWQTALDLSTGIEWAVEGGAESARTGDVRWPARPRLAWFFAAALLVALGILVLITVFGRETPRQTRAIRFAVAAPEKTTLSPAVPAVSPDGSLLAFLAVTEGRSMIWIRAMDSLVARPLAGSDLASTVFWSADGRFLAFIAGGKLKKIELSTGSVSTICDAVANSQGDWNDDGIIVFALSPSQPIHRVQAAGGVPAPLTTLDRSPGDLIGWPQWLPSGRDFLFFVRTSVRETTGIYAASLGSPTSTSKLIAESYAAGRYVPGRSGSGGHLLFLSGDTLMAQSFNHSSLTLTGDPMPVAEHVGGLMADYAGNPGFSISRNGVLAYHNITGPRAQLVWLDRAGGRAETITVSDIWSHPSLSRDGNRMAFDQPDPKTLRNDIWVADLKRGITSRLSHDPASEGVPIWSPDGERVVYNSVREGSRNLYWNASSGGQEELLFKSAESKVPTDWSPDGKFILFHQGDERTGVFDIWALPVSGDRKPFPVVQSAFSETHAQFSPDGQWVVYASNETGIKEVYARPFRPFQPASSLIPKTVQITTGGGSHPRWRRDGQELFYLNPESRVMAMPVTVGAEFETGKPQVLFQVRGARSFANILYDYDVAPNGQRFLFNLSIEGTVSPITVVVNWDAALK